MTRTRLPGLLLGAILLGACPTTPPPVAACPPCPCECAAEPAPAPVAGTSDEIAGLIASASRRMMHEDGAGCLADLDRVRAISEPHEALLAVTRGQCEMLVGRCAAGKARLAAWYERELAMSAERAAETAETLAAMRCRGGDATPRDRLLVALQNLSHGAYLDRREAAFCAENLATVEALRREVTPRDGEDTALEGGLAALFFTGATCLARAGDCVQARAVFARGFEGRGLERLQDETERRRIIDAAFASSVPLCAKAAASAEAR